MKIYILLIVLCFNLFHTGCGSEENIQADIETVMPIEVLWSDLEAVTGIYLLDIESNPFGVGWSPNDYTEEGLFYPNPVSSTATFRSYSNNFVSKIWIIDGQCLIDTVTNIRNLAPDLEYEISNISDAALHSIIMDNPTNTFQINLEMFDQGLYKLFYQTTNGNLNWQSIFLFKGEDQVNTLLSDEYNRFCE